MNFKDENDFLIKFRFVFEIMIKWMLHNIFY